MDAVYLYCESVQRLDQSLSVNFTTPNGSAFVREDYTARAGVLTFNPDETSKTISINVNGDRKRESDETFHVRLTAPFGIRVPGRARHRRDQERRSVAKNATGTEVDAMR